MSNRFVSALITGSGESGSILTVTCDSEFAGLTITVTDGVTTLNNICPSQSPYVIDFLLPNSGIWTISGTVDGETISETIDVRLSTILHYVPKGSTVTPINDIQTWLHCANIWDKDYTALDQVLVDASVLEKLMASNNAVDYMVRSTDWASDGNVGLVPTMTSNTTPSGICSTDSDNQTYLSNAYTPFSGEIQNKILAIGNTEHWIQYEFPSDVKIKKAIVQRDTNTLYSGASLHAFDAKIQSSVDGLNFTDKTETQTFAINDSNDKVFILDNPEACKYYRVYLSTYTLKTAESGVASYRVFMNKIQFYGAPGIVNNQTAMEKIGLFDYAAETLLSDATWCEAICNSTYFESVLNVKVPTMTSNTTPSGTCFAGSNDTTAWKAFDGNWESTRWDGSVYAADERSSIGYDFGIPVVIHKVKARTAFFTYRIQGSNDKSTWTNLDNNTYGYISTASLNFGYSEESIINNSAYRYIRLLKVDQATNYTRACEIQFYGRRRGSVASWMVAGECENIYSSLSALKNNPTVLISLISNHNASDYLKTAHGLIDEICADRALMEYIGLDDYCSNKLLEDSDWLEAICNSPYFESVLNVKVPTMTSNTTPSGECSGDSNGKYSGGDWYNSFDGRWELNQSQPYPPYLLDREKYPNRQGYVIYKFTQKVKINKIQFKSVNGYGPSTSDTYQCKGLEILGSNDGTNYTNLANISTTTVESASIKYANISNDTKYQYYKVYPRSGYYTGVRLQFYGRA